MRRVLAGAAVLAALLSGCSGGTPGDGPSPSGSGGSSSTPASPTSSGSTSGSSTGTSAPTGGTSDSPERLTATEDLLPWKPVPGPVDDVTTVGDGWTLTVAADASRATLRGGRTIEVAPGSRYVVSDALLDRDHAVIVVSDRRQEQPGRATVVDLASGTSYVLDGRSDVPTVNGGTWALGDGRVLHATIGPRRSYCLASVDLGTRQGTVAWCAPPRNGFNYAEIGPGGDSVMSFDDSRPSCRTVATVADGDLTPFPGVTECQAWDGLLLAGSRVWSVVPKADRIEAAHFYAAIGDAYYDLGPGRSGTLVPCGGAAYFSRDPQRDGSPAQVLRWTDDGTLSIVYEAPRGGQSVMACPPRCSGDRLTVSALAEAGDQQVTARLS